MGVDFLMRIFLVAALGASAGGVDATPKSSAAPGPLCNSSGGFERMTLYRFQGAAEMSASPTLSNRNAADAMGAVSILCLGRGGTEGYKGAMLSSWSLSINVSFGQYAMCSFDTASRTNKCYDGDKHQVGREDANCGLSPIGCDVPPLEGHCTVNDDFGSWLSFPTHGECIAGAKACRWKASRLRVITADCVIKTLVVAGQFDPAVAITNVTKAGDILARAVASSDRWVVVPTLFQMFWWYDLAGVIAHRMVFIS